jgi:hypothetical protein
MVSCPFRGRRYGRWMLHTDAPTPSQVEAAFVAGAGVVANENRVKN